MGQQHHPEHCTCGGNLGSGDENEGVIVGKMLAIDLFQNGPMHAAVISFCDAGEGTRLDDLEFEVVYHTRPYRSKRHAQRDALRNYWRIYERLHGFKHPDDPRRTPNDAPAPEMVITDGL